MKKIIAGICCLLLLVTMTACGSISSSLSQSEPPADPNAQLKSLFHGIYALEERAETFGEPTEGGGVFVPLRFNEDRLADYATQKDIPYGLCTTGVRLDFYTDAAEISFGFSITDGYFDGNPQYPVDTFDIYENGEFVTSVEVDKMGSVRKVEYTRSAAEESRITIHFPTFHGVALYDIQLGNARPVEDYAYKILYLGDSITQGLFADKTSDNYVDAISRALNADYMNLAVGGEEFRVEALDEEIGFTPDHIVICLGTNDIRRNHTPEELKSDCNAYFRKIRQIYRDTPVTVISPYGTYGDAFIKAIQDEAVGFEMNYIDGTTLLPYIEANYCFDNVHPSSTGFGVITQNLLPLLRTQLGA